MEDAETVRNRMIPTQKVTNVCLNGYFRDNKRLPQELPEFPDTTVHVVLPGLRIPARPGAAERTPRSEPHPQPAPRGAGPARQSRGRRAAAILLGGGGGAPRDRPPSPGAGPRPRQTAGIYAEPLRWRTKDKRDSGASLHTQGEHSSPGASAEGRGVAGVDYRKRGLNAIHPHQQLWSDSLQATKAEMSSRPEHATAGGLGVHASSRKCEVVTI